jgi:16S rRNA (cytosine967-C5)-methyltransferase
MPYVVQDEAAQLVGYLVNPSPGQRVLDACAAPVARQRIWQS